MNKIETLLKELCPNGVELEEIGKIIDYEQPTKYLVSSKEYNDNYELPVLTAGQTFILGYTNETEGIYQASKENPVIIFDDFTTSKKWVDFNFKVKSTAMKILKVKSGVSNILIRYVWHYLGTITYSPDQHGRQWISTYSKFKIPIPPLEIQEEIVKILDKFTDYVTELTTELTLRQKQYHYYREKLFTFEDEVKKINLSELSHYIKSGKNSVRNIVGNYPVYASTGQIGFSDSYEYNHSQILVARVGAYAGKVYTATGKYDVTDNTLMISVDNNKINFQYLYYYLVNFGLNKLAKGAGQPLITGKQLKELKVPVPSIESQKEIVMFLDKLDIVSNDLNAGLPKEIELRQKQYEFYRDKLLSFD